MTCRSVMVLLLLSDDGGDRRNGGRVIAAQSDKLLFEVAEDNALNRNGSGRNGTGPADASDYAEQITAKATQPVTAAAWPAAALQLSPEDGAVPLLMRPKLGELSDQRWCGEPRHVDLAGVDTDCAVLASMIDPDNPVAQALCGYRLSNCIHEA